MKTPESYESFAEIKPRLDEIVAAVSQDDLPLEEALSLYEEAVKLGTRVSALIEVAGAEEAEEEAAEAAEPEASEVAANPEPAPSGDQA